jgi:hypothetical protein
MTAMECRTLCDERGCRNFISRSRLLHADIQDGEQALNSFEGAAGQHLVFSREQSHRWMPEGFIQPEVTNMRRKMSGTRN